MIPQVDSMTDGVFERRGRRAVRENQAEPSLLLSNQGARLIGQASIGPCPDLACLRFSTRPVSLAEPPLRANHWRAPPRRPRWLERDR